MVRTPLPVIDKDNHLSKPNLYLSVLQMKSSSTYSITASLYKGPFFYFYVESPPSTFMHHLKEHSCHSEFNMHSPKSLSLIDLWLWFHLFLNYLYLVALLNLKVSYAFMFCYSMKDKLKTTGYVFSYDLNTCLNFIVSLFMIFHLCFFSCYNMVAKFLLSRLCLLCPYLSSLIPALSALLKWSRLWWCMSPQKLFFCYHLPTRGRAGVKFGMLIRCKRIYNFLCSILVLHQLLYVLSTLCGNFMIYLD
jgi:hypothetical protein